MMVSLVDKVSAGVLLVPDCIIRLQGYCWWTMLSMVAANMEATKSKVVIG
jgi:hypothetical protein